MRKMGLLFLLFGLLCYGGAASQAEACSCAVSLDPQAALAKADAVFAGKVLQVNTTRSSFNGLHSSADRTEVIFQVTRNWKGAADSQLAVYTAESSASCGFEFAAGQEYVVYANGSADAKDRLETGLCSRTSVLSSASDDVLQLGEGEEPIRNVDLLSHGNSRGLWLPLIGVLIAVTALILVLKNKFRSRG